MENWEVESKLHYFWRRTKEKAKKGADWCKNNKEVLAIVVPSAVGALTAGAKIIGKRNNLREEERQRNTRVWDASVGHFWNTRRELTTEEWKYIDKRHKNGERYGDILDELHLLK